MNQTTTCISFRHKQCMDSMFSRWYGSKNSRACWKCISHAPDWKNSEQFAASLNMWGKISCPLVTFSPHSIALTPASLNTLLKMIRPVFGKSARFYPNVLEKHYEDSTTVTSSRKTWVGRESKRMQALEWILWGMLCWIPQECSHKKLLLHNNSAARETSTREMLPNHTTGFPFRI